MLAAALAGFVAGVCVLLQQAELPARFALTWLALAALALGALALQAWLQRAASGGALAAARPRWASVQAGYRNRFGHPDAEVLERCVARGVHLVSGDESGASQWRFCGDGTVDLHRWRADAHRYRHNRPGFGAEKSEPAAEIGGLPDPGAAGRSGRAVPAKARPVDWP